jgi:hypothetical protein
MMPTISLKRGDSFGFTSPIQILLDGVPVTDFSGWSAACRINNATGSFIARAS